MASHYSPAIRPRSLATVLADLREAHRDFNDALAADDADAEDRATEAETRLDDLREDFDARMVATTGLTIEDLRTAYAEALL